MRLKVNSFSNLLKNYGKVRSNHILATSLVIPLIHPHQDSIRILCCLRLSILGYPRTRFERIVKPTHLALIMEINNFQLSLSIQPNTILNIVSLNNEIQPQCQKNPSLEACIIFQLSD